MFSFYPSEISYLALAPNVFPSAPDTAIALASSRVQVTDYGDFVISPGLVDVHVHLNEPGRETWEAGACTRSLLSST
jgi:hypothetical protein